MSSLLYLVRIEILCFYIFLSLFINHVVLNDILKFDNACNFDVVSCYYTFKVLLALVDAADIYLVYSLDIAIYIDPVFSLFSKIKYRLLSCCIGKK
jgi:hypothetical protein